MGKHKPRNKAMHKGRHKMFSNASINTGKGPNPIAVQEYYNRTKQLSDTDFRDRNPTKQTLVIGSMQHQQVKDALSNLFGVPLTGLENFQRVKVCENGDLTIHMFSLGERYVFVERRTFPPTVENPRGDIWVKRSKVYTSRKLAMTAFNLGKIHWIVDKVNEPLQEKSEPVVVGRSLNRY